MLPSKKQQHSYKIINDPIYGFIPITDHLIFELIATEEFQRLRRISQMGLSYLVYPGAQHTRFQHAIGAMHLMQRAIDTLKRKGVIFSDEEHRALLIAILLHDIGHGPFSHALEKAVIPENAHESISLGYMQSLNKKFEGALSLAIKIFQNKYPRKFFYQLIASQLDMDRLDYLQRDSFYTGVVEGNINADRLITMLNVVNEELVLEEKSIYSAEHFIVGRRLMYWQVYFHKTAIVAENLLTRTFKRAKYLAKNGDKIFASPALSHFLNDDFKSVEKLPQFTLLDDYDILGAMKQWCFHQDELLAYFSKAIVNRKLLKIKISNQPIEKLYEEKLERVQKNKTIPKTLAYDLVFKGSVSNRAYNNKTNPILIQKKDGTLQELSKVSDQANLKALSEKVVKHYVCFPSV